VAQSANKTQKKLFLKKSNKISKNAECYADFKTFEKVAKMHTQNVIRKPV
jgi:hypothetical protein